jgi:hypothetical protein
VTSADSAEHFMETMEFQAESGEFEIVEDRPFILPNGEDAHFSAVQWTNYESTFQWALGIIIVTDGYSNYFIMYGDDPVYFSMYGELIEDIGSSYNK